MTRKVAMPKKSGTLGPKTSPTMDNPTEITLNEAPSSETAHGPQSSTTAVEGTEMTPNGAEPRTTTSTGYIQTAANTAHGHITSARKAAQDGLRAGVAAAQTIPDNIRSAGQTAKNKLSAGTAAIKRVATNLIDYILVTSCDDMQNKADCNRACLGRRTEKGIEALVGKQAAVRCRWVAEEGAPINDARTCEKGTATCST